MLYFFYKYRKYLGFHTKMYYYHHYIFRVLPLYMDSDFYY